MTRENNWEQHRESYKPVKTSTETARRIETMLLANGWLKPVLEGERKYKLPVELEASKYYTQVEIIGQEDVGVFLIKDLIAPQASQRRYCRVSHFENWSYGQKDKKSFWQPYFPGR